MQPASPSTGSTSPPTDMGALESYSSPDTAAATPKTPTAAGKGFLRGRFWRREVQPASADVAPGTPAVANANFVGPDSVSTAPQSASDAPGVVRLPVPKPKP